MDHDKYIKQVRRITHPELAGASPETESTKLITDMLVSLKSALAYTALTQN